MGWAFIASANQRSATLDTARHYVGVHEVGGNNRGASIRRFLASVDLPEGQPWCAAFPSYCLDAAHAVRPTTRTGLALGFLRKNKYVSARDVYMGLDTVPVPSIMVFRDGATYKGHAGFVEVAKGNRVWTIEGNTSSGVGSQRDGDGVYRRTRLIEPWKRFRIVGFVPVVDRPERQ